MNKEITQIYVKLLDEGTDTIRPTQAEVIAENTYRLLPTPDYDSEDEVWEFLPGSTVKCKTVKEVRSGSHVLLAVEKIG